MQMPSCVSVLTVIDTHLSSLLYCSPFLLLLLKAMDRSHQGRLSESVGWNDQLQHRRRRRPGNKAMLVLGDHIECSQAPSFNNSGCDWDCHSLYVCINLRGVFSFSRVPQPRVKRGLRLKPSWWTWDAAGPQPVARTLPHPECQDGETSIKLSAGNTLFVSIDQSLHVISITVTLTCLCGFKSALQYHTLVVFA